MNMLKNYGSNNESCGIPPKISVLLLQELLVLLLCFCFLKVGQCKIKDRLL